MLLYIYIYIYIYIHQQCETKTDHDNTGIYIHTTHEQLKERKTFWQRRLKTFYPTGLNEKRSSYINIRTYLSYSLRLQLI